MPNTLIDTSRLLFTLLRSSLWGNVSLNSITADQFQCVMALADEQTVAGLVFEVLNAVQIDGMEDKMPIYEAVGLTERIKQQNNVVNKELAWFVNKCQDVGLECLVVKGQTLASLYPKPNVRQSGDIDFLTTQIAQTALVFPDEDFPNKMTEKEFAFSHHGITYELHCRLIDFGCKKHQQQWAEMEAREWCQKYSVKVNGVEVRTLSPTMNAAYLFVHLFFHLIREGVSLRQFCDWAVFLHAYHDKIDRLQLTEFMKCLNMLNGYKAFGSILIDELGLPEEEFPMEITEEDRRWKEKILCDVFRGGNFGKHNHQAKSALGYKMETLRFAMRNSFRYYKLAPSEMRMMIPKMIGINVRLLFN
jgi:hypothetical protein